MHMATDKQSIVDVVISMINTIKVISWLVNRGLLEKAIALESRRNFAVDTSY